MGTDLAIQYEKERTKTIADSYSMSIGEIANLYEDGDLDVHPEFQRVFRWSDGQKSKLIESILLGIPLPSFFVSSNAEGIWDVVDGVQRLSTIFSFLGIYKDENEAVLDKLILEGTAQLPSLKGLTVDDIPKDIMRTFKREKINVTIIKQGSDTQTKYELFQRLNTTGSPLSDQEVRNCILLMENKDFYKKFIDLSAYDNFQSVLSFTERLADEKYDQEMLSRFIVFTQNEIITNDELRDLGRYLNKQMRELVGTIDLQKLEVKFKKVFDKLYNALGEDAFRRYEGGRYTGGFKLTLFEVLALGMGQLELSQIDDVESGKILEISHSLVVNPIYISNTGSGKSASNRLKNLIELGKSLFSS
jgi:hypothetical protein